MTRLLVAAGGGHLTQLVELSARLGTAAGGDIWVTFDSPQSRSLLAGRRSIFIEPVEERDVKGVVRAVSDAHRIFREHDISTVVSTGSGVALSFLPYAALRGISAHYIESAARVGKPSLTGRLLQLVPGIQLYRQYPHAAQGRWRYAGSVFDGFQAADSGRRPLRKIVVTLGSGVHGFRRLVERLVAIIPPDVDVLWQTGSTAVSDLSIDAREFVPADELEKAIFEADAIIGHAGCGSALSALNSGKFPLLVPRQPEFGELVDHHQVELARFLSDHDLAISRTPATLMFKDIERAASRRVSRRADPPILKLANVQ